MVGIGKSPLWALLLLCSFPLVMMSSACGGAPGPAGEAPVYIMLPSVEAKAGTEFEARVCVELEDQGVSGGEILFAFDASAMEAVSVEPGDLLGSNPLVGLKEIDNQAGTVKYAIARVGSTSVPTPPGVFAILKLKVSESAESGAYELRLGKVGLADEAHKDIAGIRAGGVSIKVIP